MTATADKPLKPAAPLVLASASARRLDLLAGIGIVPDAVIPPEIDESPLPAERPRDHARRLARAKATACVRLGAFVLAADTVVAAGHRVLPKAEDAETASRCLSLLSGRRHRVFTAVVLVGPDGRRGERLVETAVTFARLTRPRMEAYLESEEWRGKAGGYAIQGRAAGFVRFLSGSHSNVIGLPLFETTQLLRGLGYPVP